jgi:hypothetical protein
MALIKTGSRTLLICIFLEPKQHPANDTLHTQTKMAAANDASSASAASHHQAMANAVSCDQNADYAVICSFFEQFGDKSGLLFPSFQDLKVMLENTDEGQYCLGWPLEPVVP